MIGVLSETGGVTVALPALEATLTKQTGAQVLYDTSSEHLADRLLKRYLSEEYVCPCHPG